MNKLFGRGVPVGAILIVVLLLWLASGIFIINPGEVGVVTRFGKYDRQVGDGPHYHLPTPFESVEIVIAEPLRTVVIGQGSGTGRANKGAAEESSMFTGDENIVHMRFNVQYNISDAQAFLFSVQDPETTIKIAAEAAMREVVGRSNIDSILTTGRAGVQTEAMTVLENILALYNLGVRIHTVQLLDVQPPPEVEEAFKDVASAREDKVRFVNQAEAYRMQIVPVANGTAMGMLNAAKAYKQQVEQAADGEARRFLSMVAEFEKAQEVTKKRMYLETMSELLSAPGLHKMILSKDIQGSLLPLLNLDPAAKPLPAFPAEGAGK